MKILKEGKKQKKKSVEITCKAKGYSGTGCGSLLLVDSSDLYETTEMWRDEKITNTTFRCPHCNKQNNVNRSKFPDDISIYSSEEDKNR